MKTKTFIVLVAMISTITLLLCTNESSAQKKELDSDWSYSISGESIITYTLTKTRFGKTTHEIIINYDNSNKKIVAVKEDGVSIQPNEYANYLNYIESSKKAVEGVRTDTEHLLADLDKMHGKVLNHQLQIREVLEKMVSKIESSGYEIENKPFRIEYKNNWMLNFSDKIYLDNKLLPEDLTQELLTISKNYKFDSSDTASLTNLTDGLDKAILEIDKEIKQINSDLFVKK
ncbi:MAG: hypothetical protein AB9846_14495 [Tenuifilaceae bacterium]